MKLFLNGYYGYNNAGDEAVLAAMLEHLGAHIGGAEFLVTSGSPAQTEALHTSAKLRALPRQQPRALLAAMRECDLFISGGGSLVQDATSLRNVVYYVGLMRLAKLSRKPMMVYAQGVGPLRRPPAQKLARVGFGSARVLTVRDDASKQLLQRIGVAKNIEVTADPVWALSSRASSSLVQPRTWCVALRAPTHGEADFAAATEAVRVLAKERGATLLWLPMQSERDLPLIAPFLAPSDELIPTDGVHPGEILGRIAGCERMIAMRLHALIFSASQGVPCVGINYDPKVEALCKIMDAPLLQDLSAPELAKLPGSVSASQPMSAARRDELARLAQRNAELAAGILR